MDETYEQATHFFHRDCGDAFDRKTPSYPGGMYARAFGALNLEDAIELDGPVRANLPATERSSIDLYSITAMADLVSISYGPREKALLLAHIEPTLKDYPAPHPALLNFYVQLSRARILSAGRGHYAT